jgi:biopolymer transport protein ExbD
MPSVKIPRKSTATDMTPFVDVAFLILSFFMLATKFKPPAPVEITTPRSVSSDKLKEQDAVLVEFDSAGHVYFTMNVQKLGDESNKEKKRQLIRDVAKERNVSLTDNEVESFVQNSTVGSPIASLKALLSVPRDKRGSIRQPGIPVDSTNNELQIWITHAVNAFQGMRLNYMIKGDNKAKYPSFRGVIDAFRKNEIYKYQLITDPENAPSGTELYMRRQKGIKEI